MMLRFFTSTSLAIAALAVCGCSSSEPAPRAYETLLPDDHAAILAMMPYRDGILLARNGELQTFEPKTGTGRTLSGPSYARCPFRSSDFWPDLFYPSPRGARLTAKNALELVTGNCGVWRFDPEHPDVTTPLLGYDPKTSTSLWGTTPGPSIKFNIGPTFTADSGNDTIVCAQVDTIYHDDGKTFDPAHVELWSIDADARGAHSLFVSKWSTSASDPIFPPEHCLGLAANADDVFWISAVSATLTLSHLTRATGAVNEVTHWFGNALVPNEMLVAGNTLIVVPYTKDGTGGDDPAALYLPVLAIDIKSGLTRTLLNAGRADAPVRYDFKVDGPNLYWLDGLSLRRMPLAGGDVETLVEGDLTTGNGAFPDYAIGSDFVYFSHVSGRDDIQYGLQRTPK